MNATEKDVANLVILALELRKQFSEDDEFDQTRNIRELNEVLAPWGYEPIKQGNR